CLLMLHIAAIQLSVYLNKIKTKEYKYPNQVYKVPVQTGFLDHQVMTSSVKYTFPSHDQHYDVYYNTREYVKAMETCDAKEISAECNGPLLTNMRFSQVDHTYQFILWHFQQISHVHISVMFVHH